MSMQVMSLRHNPERTRSNQKNSSGTGFMTWCTLHTHLAYTGSATYLQAECHSIFSIMEGNRPAVSLQRMSSTETLCQQILICAP